MVYSFLGALEDDVVCVRPCTVRSPKVQVATTYVALRWEMSTCRLSIEVAYPVIGPTLFGLALIAALAPAWHFSLVSQSGDCI